MAVLLPSQVTRVTIPPGDAGTRATAFRMMQLIRQGASDPLVRETAVGIVAAISGRDAVGQARAIRAWLVQYFHFLRDPSEIELLQTPHRLLTVLAHRGSIYGDCDDAAILGGALGQAIGLRARLVVVGFLSLTAPFRHVWVEVAAPSGPSKDTWTELDVTRRAQQIPVSKIARAAVWPVKDQTETTLPLLAGVALACIMAWGLISSTP